MKSSGHVWLFRVYFWLGIIYSNPYNGNGMVKKAYIKDLYLKTKNTHN